jgi:hypothetical protein
MRYRMRWRLAMLATMLALTGLGACGCHWLTAYFMEERHPKKLVKAEYNLTAQKLLIVPYVSTEILFNDSTIPLDISSKLAMQIQQHLRSERIKSIVHPVEVNKWQESNVEWQNMKVMDMAKAFGADAVLYVEVEDYSTIEERSANLYRGRVRAHIQVVRPDADHNPVYDGIVETVFPKDQPVSATGTTENRVRMATNEVFAEDVMFRFYDHEVEIVGGKK